MKLDDIKIKLEEAGLTPDQVDELSPLLVGEGQPVPAEVKPELSTAKLIERLAGEGDWRRAAAISAALISLKMD